MNFEQDVTRCEQRNVTSTTHMYANNKHVETYSKETIPSTAPSAHSNTVTGPSLRDKRQLLSRAAVTHKFKKLKTPSKCRECDSYVYFQGKFKIIFILALWQIIINAFETTKL